MEKYILKYIEELENVFQWKGGNIIYGPPKDFLDLFSSVKIKSDQVDFKQFIREKIVNNFLPHPSLIVAVQVTPSLGMHADIYSTIIQQTEYLIFANFIPKVTVF